LTCIKAIPCLSISLGQPRIEPRSGASHAANLPPILAVQCGAEYVWLMPIIMPLVALVLAGVPVASILHRAGRSRWWMLIAFIPLLNLIGLWVFAFTRWPAVDRVPA
jgi:uncharacterized membrane protein YhaH (DUF805 family)